MSIFALSQRLLRMVAAGFALAAVAQPSAAQELPPGAGFMTRFPGTVERSAGGVTETVIDPDGVSGAAIDLTRPGRAPDGTAWRTPASPFRVTAGQVGQVFGVALDDAPQPNVYLTATSAFGLHRNADNSGWMDAMWGQGGGPGTVYRLDSANGYRPEVFAQVTLDGRANSGAALGNIAFDRWNRQFYVSDLETGMIHRLALADGYDAGRFDHGVEGRAGFVDAATGQQMSLPAVAFDPASSAHVADCASGDFSRDPACWNVADFRRRVWGLAVRRDGSTGAVRLYYAVWGSQGFGSADHAAAGDDARNSVWSVGIDGEGRFDASSMRREFFLPDFFRSAEAIARAGVGHPVADLAFPAYGDQRVMLVSERGGLRNRGLTAATSFAFAGESRVLRYELGTDGTWRPAGRFDVGFPDRRADGPPYLRAGAAGGAAFGMGYDDGWSIDRTRPDAVVWMTGDGLCAPEGACTDGSTTRIDGLQGNAADLVSEVEPAAAFQPYPTPGPATPAMAPNAAYMIDADLAATDEDNATEVGDIAVHQSVPAVAEIPGEGPWYGPWPGAWPWPIPVPDGGTPPPPGDGIPELQITKATPPVCDWGATCDFLLTITNNGPGVYDGPLLVADFIEAGTLVEAGPDWTCLQEGIPGPVICRHDTVVLAAGESLFLPMVFHMPLPIHGPPAWNTELQNCGFIVWPTALPDLGHVQSVQAALRLRGYYAGPINGTVDPATQAAIDAWRADHGLPPGGIDAALDASLFPGSAGMAGDADPDNDMACAIYILPGAGGMEPPPPATSFDLAVTKALVGAVACTPSAPCDFNITITNVGGAPFNGPIVFGDIAGTDAGGPFPAGAVVSASPGVTCSPSGGGNRCSRDGMPVLDLAPGASVAYAITVNVPATAVPGHELLNCAVVDWAAMGLTGDAVPGNDWMCVDVPLVPAAAPAAADLQIEKAATTPNCAAGALCTFMVTVRNVGAVQYDGTIAFSDLAGIMGMGPLTGVIQTVAPGFGCDPGMPGTGSLCGSAAEIHLLPGAAIGIPVSAFVPAVVPPGSDLRNCVSVAWDHMAFPGGRDFNAANDENACATVPIVMVAEQIAFDLAVTKTGPGTCMQGVPCHYTIDVTNNGPASYDGTLWVLDQWDVGPIAGLATTPATWQCLTGNFRGIDCQHETFTLAPGESTTLQVVWPVPAEQPLGPIQNCATIRHPQHGESMERIQDVQNGLRFAGYPDVPSDGILGDATLAAIEAYRAANGLAPGTAIDEELLQSLFPGDAGATGDTNSGNDTACVTTEIVGSGPAHWADLAPSGGTECVRGSTCTLDVRIDNRGDAQFDGAAGLRGRLDPSVTVQSVTGATPGLMCGVTGPGAYECLGSALSIKPGDAARLTVLIAIPADFGPDRITHTKDMVWPDPAVKDRNAENDRHVSTITIVDPEEVAQAADLVVAKLANQGRCTAGEPCRFSVSVTNKGPGAWSGALSIADTITPATTRLTGSSPSEWTCKGGSGSVACGLAEVTLAPGASRALSLTFTTARTAKGTLKNCARLDWAGPTVIEAVQLALNNAGFPVGKADGIAGSRTNAAIAAYRKAKGLGGSGVDNALLQSLGLEGIGDAVAANDEACVEVALVAPQEPATGTQGSGTQGSGTQGSGTQGSGTQGSGTQGSGTQGSGQSGSGTTTEEPRETTGPVCPQGWQQVGPAQAALFAAQGRQIRPVTKAGKTILCLAPQRVKPTQQEETAPVCPRGFTQVTRAEAKTLVARGYEIRQVGSGNASILCARKAK